MNIFLPSAIILTIFWFIWIIKYPTEVWESLTFRFDTSNIYINIFMCVCMWLATISVSFVSITVAGLIS